MFILLKQTNKQKKMNKIMMIRIVNLAKWETFLAFLKM